MGSGGSKERDLVVVFHDAGWFAMRAAASGSATARMMPDVIAAKNGHVIVMELKYSGRNIIYLDEDEIESIQFIADKFDGYAYVVGRWKQDTNFYGFAPHECGRTGSGKYSIKHEWAKEGDAIVLPPAY